MMRIMVMTAPFDQRANPRELPTGVSTWSKRPVLLALFLLRLSCESKPLLLLLLEPRSRHGIRSRSSSDAPHASETMQMC
jgi:hypothetical protein